MKEPFRSQFRDLIRKGAAVQDVQDTSTPTGFAVTHTRSTEAFIDREAGRAEIHLKRLIPLLDTFVGRVDSVLDVGCSTGGTTVALALSSVLQPDEVVGVDPNLLSLEAARVRALGHDLSPERVRFEKIVAGEPLPFPDCRFGLTVCVSVLEYVSTDEGRAFLASELTRVTRPGGFVYLATPNPYRIREYHTGRLFGSFRRREAYPWSSTPRNVRRLFPTCRTVPLSGYLMGDVLRRVHLRGGRAFAPLTPLLGLALPWHRYLFRKPDGGGKAAP